ncbi:MAG: rRNA pseudouridine synthase [Lachnospiraceae bacterium]|nr:rRNA pseudouridine synthase [Lachnospiraceae bacterium]
MQIRLDKFLADAKVGSRSEVKEYIKKGRIRINDEIAQKAETKIDTEKDKVCFDRERVWQKGFVYYMLNKPKGVVSATTDNLDKTVVELLRKEKYWEELFPVGRLDKDTEGLLLLTNDGVLAHNLLSPKKHVNKVYYALIKGFVTEEDVASFKEGLDIGEKKNTMPSDLHILKSGEISEIEVTICEGKFHQVKRMFQAVSKEVIYLKRISMGKLELDKGLQPGEYRPLTEEEIALLKTR